MLSIPGIRAHTEPIENVEIQCRIMYDEINWYLIYVGVLYQSSTLSSELNDPDSWRQSLVTQTYFSSQESR